MSKVVIIVLFVIVLAIAGVLTSQLQTGFDLKDLCPDDSYLRQYYEADESVFGKGWQTPTSVYFKDVDYSNVEVQAQITRTTTELKYLKWIDPEYEIISWHKSFTEWCEKNSKYKSQMSKSKLDEKSYLGGNLFKPALTEFLDSDYNKRFKADIVFDSNGDIASSLISATHRQFSSTKSRADCLTGMEEFAASQPFTPKPIAYSYLYIFWDEFRVIMFEMIQNFALVLVAVVVICAVALVHPGSAVLMLFLLAMIDLNILAAVQFWGFTVNSITTICLVMSVGLVVDYTLHIVHNFGLQDATLSRNQRVRATLAEMAPSVLLGAVSTFLGVLPLAFANSALFRIFFKMFMAIVFFGITHGLVLCPVLLSLVGPAAPPRPETSRETKKLPGEDTFDESNHFSYLQIERRAGGTFGVKFTSLSQDGSDEKHHVLVSGSTDPGSTDPGSAAQEGDMVVSVNSKQVCSLQELRDTVAGNEDARIRLRRRLYALADVTRLGSQVQIFGLFQMQSRKYNYQPAEVVKELESGWITVMLLDPSFDRKLLLLSPLNLVPYAARETDQVVRIAATTY